MSEEENKVVEEKKEASSSKFGKIKLAFIYTLVAGLAAAAIISIIAILIGDFTSGLQKGFGTIVTFILHSLFILGLIWADRNDSIGKTILPTTFIGVALLSLVTTTLNTWGIISSELGNQFFIFYSLAIGVAFITTALVKLSIKHKLTKGLIYGTIGTVLVWSLALIPWIFKVVDEFNPVYFRALGALTILISTLFIITIILRTVAISKDTGLKLTKPKSASLSGGLLAYYIVVGVFVSVIWMAGMVSLIIDSVKQENNFNKDSNSSVEEYDREDNRRDNLRDSRYY